MPRHIGVADVRRTINRTTTFNKWIYNMTPEVRNIYKIMWKRGEIRSNFSSFPQYFFYLFLDFHVKIGTRISLRYKRLFEIREVKITRVDCNYLLYHRYLKQCNLISTWVKLSADDFLKYSRLSISRTRLSRITAYLGEHLVPVLTQRSTNRQQNIVEKRRNCPPLFHNIFNISLTWESD